MDLAEVWWQRVPSCSFGKQPLGSRWHARTSRLSRYCANFNKEELKHSERIGMKQTVQGRLAFVVQKACKTVESNQTDRYSHNFLPMPTRFCFSPCRRRTSYRRLVDRHIHPRTSYLCQSTVLVKRKLLDNSLRTLLSLHVSGLHIRNRFAMGCLALT